LQEVQEPFFRVQGRISRFEPRTYCFLQKLLEKGGIGKGAKPPSWVAGGENVGDWKGGEAPFLRRQSLYPG